MYLFLGRILLFYLFAIKCSSKSKIAETAVSNFDLFDERLQFNKPNWPCFQMNWKYRCHFVSFSFVTCSTRRASRSNFWSCPCRLFEVRLRCSSDPYIYPCPQSNNMKKRFNFVGYAKNLSWPPKDHTKIRLPRSLLSHVTPNDQCPLIKGPTCSLK